MTTTTGWTARWILFYKSFGKGIYSFRKSFIRRIFAYKGSFDFDWITHRQFELNSSIWKFDGNSILFSEKFIEELDNNDIGGAFAKSNGFRFKTV